MERIRSRLAHALGGAVRVRGGGLLALAAVGLLAGAGCSGPRALRMKDILPDGWVPREPVTQIVCAFNPQIQHLPDPTKDGVMSPGLTGQLYLIAASGQFTGVHGDLYVMAEDITPRAPGQPAALTEIWHFDAATLRRLKSTDERFGDCYALFLPYPPNWKDVTQIRVSTQYKPKGDSGKEPTLPGSPQTVLLDFTPPGEQPSVWLKKDEAKPTAPVEIKAMPNVARDIASGRLTAPLAGPQPNYATVPAGGAPPVATGPVTPAGGASGPLPPAGLAPFAPPAAATPPPSAAMPALPPPMAFTPDRPQASVRGPNGEPLTVTAMALPPGQSVPTGWQQKPDGSIQPAGANTPPATGFAPQQQQLQQQSQWPQQQWQQPQQQGSYAPPPNYVPASAKYQSPSEKNQGRIQHGAFNPPQAQTGQPWSPPAPAVPGGTQFPPTQGVPTGGMPLPTNPGGASWPAVPTSPPPASSFDPNSPTGSWANPPPAPTPPPTGVSGTPTIPTVPPLPSNPDAPLVPNVLPR